MAVLDTVLYSTLQKSRKKLIFASMKANALMAWAFANDRIELEDGGRHITNPLILGRNPNISSYQYYNQLPVAQTNEFTQLEYTWSRVAGSVIISDQEEDENTGSTAIFKLMKAKMDILEASIKEKFSQYLYGSGSGTDPLGLAALIPDDPTTGTLGGINRATETQWRTSSYNFAGTLDETVIEEAMDDVLMDLSPKGEKPTIILAGRNIVRFYRGAVRDKVVLELATGKAGDRMADMGFAGFTHNNIPIVYDEDCGVNRMYFINDKFLRVHIFRHVNMKVKDLVAPWDTDAIGKRVVWQGQYCMWRAYRTHAVVQA